MCMLAVGFLCNGENELNRANVLGCGESVMVAFIVTLISCVALLPLLFATRLIGSPPLATDDGTLVPT